MTNATHTPGPWRYYKQGDGTRLHVTARPTTKPGNSQDDFAQIDYRHEADARLIAAAPDLLAALQTLQAAVADNNYFAIGNAFEDGGYARAALAKVSP